MMEIVMEVLENRWRNDAGQTYFNKYKYSNDVYIVV